MTSSTAPGPDPAWPVEPRARAMAEELYASVASAPLVSVHNGLPARYLAEDLPITDPMNLLISHDQGIQALLRGSGIRTEFAMTDGWRAEHASRQAFVLLWRHLVVTLSQPWMLAHGEEAVRLAGLPPLRADRDPAEVYDELVVRLAEEPLHPRRLVAAADLRRFATSDDPADQLRAHEQLAEDPTLSGLVVPTFSPDRYLDPGRRGWRTDADLLAEVTGLATDDLDGFLAAVQERRRYFLDRGALASEHHASDVAIRRLPRDDAARLYGLARSGELLPDEALAFEGHLLWEAGRMAAEDGLVMSLFPPAGFSPRTRTTTSTTTGAVSSADRGVAERVRPLLTDFGAEGLRLQLFTVDTEAYVAEILPLAAEHAALSAVPPTRFADHPAELRAVRVAGVTAQGVPRSLGVVDDMSGPFVLSLRHGLGRRLDAGALAELVLAGRFSVDEAQAELVAAVEQVSRP